MTYSHNSVRNNIKMTTASATKSIRLKKGAAAAAASTSSSSSSSSSTPPPPARSASTPSVTAHSNSIASSTNFNNNSSNHHFHQQQQHALSTSPTICAGSLTSTPNNRQQRQQLSQSAPQRSRHQQQQRHSPQQQSGGGGFFFANNSRRSGGAGVSIGFGSGGVGQNSRSPQSAIAAVRQSPATILGGGFSPAAGAVGQLGNSARKQRKSPTTTFGVGGKTSPQHPLIPTALTHFAGSKCFDAPAPTALPKPPQHWTLSKSEEKLASSAGPTLRCLLRGDANPMLSSHHHGHVIGHGHVVKSSKRNLLDDFDTHNLKLLLNVQS